MKIREFLKPDWRKILVFILIISLIPIYIFLSNACDPDSALDERVGHLLSYNPLKDERPFPYIISCILASTVLLFIILIIFIPSFILVKFGNLLFGLLFRRFIFAAIVTIMVFYLYSLSCLIIFIYDKIRGRVK